MTDKPSSPLSRRKFVGTAAGAAIAGIAARVANSATAAVTAVREALHGTRVERANER